MSVTRKLIVVARRKAATTGVLSGNKGWLLIAKLLSPGLALRRTAMTTGLFGGQPGWLAVFGLITMKRVMQSANRRDSRILATEVLRQGQFVRLESVRKPTKRELRAAKRQRS